MMIVFGSVASAAVVALLVAARRTPRRGGGALGRRIGVAMGGVAAVAVLALLISGARSGAGVTLVALFLVSAAGVVFSRFRRDAPVAEPAWSSSTAATVAAIGAGHPEGTGRVRAAMVARALGRVEARELSTSAWFGVGVGFCVVLFVLFGIVWADQNNQTWAEFAQLASWFAHPLVGMSVLAGHRAATRSARDETSELFDTCPTDPLTRTAGFLLTAVVPVAALTAFFAILGVTVAVTSPLLHGPIGIDPVADVASAIALGAGGVALGVALGRWVRFALAPVVAVVAIALATTSLNGVGGHGWNPLVALSTASTIEGPSPVFAARPTLWHLGWLVVLIVVVVVVALARHRRDRTVAAVAVAAAVAVLVCGIGATRPLPPGSARRIAEFVARPEAHQQCAQLGGPVEACVFPFHRELLGRLAERVGPIAQVLPAGLAPIRLRQRYTGKVADLPPEVRRACSFLPT